MNPIISSYTPDATVLFWVIPIIIVGYLFHRRQDKLVKGGEKKGVKPSRTFFDYMFYNRIDDV